MPELPEVETVRRGLAPVLEGARFAKVEQRRADLRFPFPKNFAKRLKGRRVERLDRRAKYLLVWLDDGEVLAMHLGMSGRFVVDNGTGKGQRKILGEFVQEAGEDGKHDHLILTMSNGAVIRYNDARRFGYMTLIEPGKLDEHPLFHGLGIEPLSDALTADFLAARGKGRKQPLKAFLLDQRVLAGIGNIYACEALYRAKLMPDRPASVLALAERRALGGGETARPGHPRSAGRCARSRRLVLARLSQGGRFARLFPAPFLRLWPGEQAMLAQGLRRHHRPQGTKRPLDFLLSGLPEVTGHANNDRNKGAAKHGLSNHSRRTARPRRADHAQPPRGAERTECGADRGAEHGAR